MSDCHRDMHAEFAAVFDDRPKMRLKRGDMGCDELRDVLRRVKRPGG